MTSHTFTIRELLDEWLALRAVTYLPSTIKARRHMIQKWILPYLGDLPVYSVTAPVLIEYFQNLHHDVGERRYTVYDVRNLLWHACRLGVQKGLLTENPMNLIRFHAPVKKARRPCLTEDELRYLLGRSDHRAYNIFVFLLVTGLRRGEALGLCWKDIDLQQNTAYIHQEILMDAPDSVHYRRTLYHHTKNSVPRHVPLSREAVHLLMLQHKQQEELKHRYSGWQNPHGFVFTRPDGSPIHPGRLTRDFHHLMSAGGYGSATLHSLRHTAATKLLEGTFDITLTRHFLGHLYEGSTVRYCHISPAEMQRFADDIGQAIEAVFPMPCEELI